MKNLLLKQKLDRDQEFSKISRLENDPYSIPLVALNLPAPKRQCGLKSEKGSWIRVKKFRFFQTVWQTKNRFFRANFQTISIF